MLRTSPGRLVLLAALLGCGLVACGSPSRSGAPQTTTLHIWYSTDDPVEHRWAQTLAADFAHAHRNIHVDFRAYGFDDFNVKMQLALSSGHPPDLAYATPRAPGIPIYVKADQLLGLNSAAARYHWANALRGNLLADYNAPFPLYAGHPATTGRIAPIYAVPSAVAAVAVLYNTRLLAQLRVGVPRSPAAFDADVRAAKRAGMVPLGLGNADGWLGDDWYLTLANTQFSPPYLESELRLNPAFTFHRPGFLRSSRLLDAWSRAGDFTPDFGGLDAQEGIDAFFHGHTLFQLISSSEDAQILADERATNIPIGLFAFPLDGSGQGVVPWSGYEGWIVPKRSGNPSAAVTFINWMLKPTTTRFLLRQGALPAARVSPAMIQALPKSAGFLASYLIILDSARPGVYLDAAPVNNLNATMEANVQLLLQQIEQPSFLPGALETVYGSRGSHPMTSNRIDGEF